MGDQTSGTTLATNTITPTTANGLVVDATAWWGCTDISASPGLYAGIATNSGNGNVCAPSNTTASTLNEDNGLALYYNPNTAAVTFTYTDTGSVQQWASVASAFKSGATSTSVALSGVAPSNGSTAGGTAATNVVVVNSTTITATTPAGSPGAVTVAVTNSNGLSGSLGNAFTYVAPPTVSSVSPNSGSTARIGIVPPPEFVRLRIAPDAPLPLRCVNHLAESENPFGRVQVEEVARSEGVSIGLSSPTKTD